MTINKAGLDLIKQFEGFRAQTYDDGVGVLTIGYGTTGKAGVGINPIWGMTITEYEAQLYLQKAIDKFAKSIEHSIVPELNENQWAACLSLAYNIGPSAFKSSSVLRYINAGNMKKAADAFLMWNKATVGGKKIVLKGLVRRRKAERKLFLKPVPKVAHNPLPRWLLRLLGK